MSGLGRGLLTGLVVTWRNLMHRSVTAHYPDALPELPPRSRGVIALMEENCTVCMLCARECPAWCIYIDSHKEASAPATPGGRERSHNMLDRFAIDFSLCMYCSICIEACPFDALYWSPEFEYSEFDIRELTHEKDRLQEWMWTVPPPPAVDAAAVPPKEIATAEKAAARNADSAPGDTPRTGAPRAGASRAGGAPRARDARAGAAGEDVPGTGVSGKGVPGEDDPGREDSRRGDR